MMTLVIWDAIAPHRDVTVMDNPTDPRGPEVAEDLYI